MHEKLLGWKSKIIEVQLTGNHASKDVLCHEFRGSVHQSLSLSEGVSLELVTSSDALVTSSF